MSDRLIRYTLDGIELTHDISFGVTDGDGFDVYVNRTKLDKGIDYKVVGTDEQLRGGDGTITLTIPHAASDVLLILSDTLARRVTNFAKAARFEEAEIDNEFDNLLRLLEDAALNLQSTPYFSPPDIGLVNGELPPLIAGGVLRVNTTKNGFELVELDKVPEFEEALRKATEQANKSEAKAQEAAQTVAGFDQHAESKKQEVNQIAEQASDSAELSKKWAEGETPSGDQPSDTNNAKYWSGQAHAAMAGKVNKLGGDAGAIEVTTGTEAQKPDAASQALALLRFTNGKGFEGYDPEQKIWGGIGGGIERQQLNTVVIYAYRSGGATPAAITLPTGYKWSDFERIEWGMDYATADYAQTCAITKEQLSDPAWKSVIRQDVAPSPIFMSLSRKSETQCDVGNVGIVGANGGLRFITGYINKYATENVSKIIQVNGGADIAANQRYEIDIATVLGADYVGKDLIVEVEIYNDGTSGGKIGWGVVPITVHYAGSYASYGVNAGVLESSIEIYTGNTHLCASGNDGRVNVFATTSAINAAPCRVKVWKIDHFITNVTSSVGGN
ncbi:coil containing protein [Vibrio phage 1.257.O._10N.286.46.A4]|nr:coil containing protein [Vibrio phage 1.257.O._10N.286.46.A4]